MPTQITATEPLNDGENLVTVGGVKPNIKYWRSAEVVDGQVLMFYETDTAVPETYQVYVYVLASDVDIPAVVAGDRFVGTILLPDGTASEVRHVRAQLIPFP